MPRQRANGVSATSAKVERAEKVGCAVGRAWAVGGAVHVGQYYQRMSTLFYCDYVPRRSHSARPTCYSNPVQAALRFSHASTITLGDGARPNVYSGRC